MPSRTGLKAKKLTQSQSRKVSMLNQSSYATTIAETIRDQLIESDAPIKLVLAQLNSLRKELHGLDTNDNASSSIYELVSEIVQLVDSNPANCQRLRSYTFAAVVELFLHTRHDDSKSRGLFLLARFVHNETNDVSHKSTFLGNLIGENCLVSVCELLCNEKESFASRIWAGILVLQLIVNAEDNQDVIQLMPENRRTRLGSMVLFGGNEILRAVAGQIIANLVSSGHPVEKYFPSETAPKLFKNYPTPAPSASQWDKSFQEYVDGVWDEVALGNKSSNDLQFAQAVTTIPPCTNDEPTQRHRSVYIEFADTMHIFVPSGGQVFDLLIDIPYSSISAMNIRQTLLDTELPNHPADVALELKEASTVVINSEKIDITELLLMVGNRSNAEKLLQTITKHSAAYVSAPYSLFASKKTSRTNSQESTRSKVSWADEPLEFKKEYVSSPNSPAVESSMACAADQGLELSDVVGQIERMDMYTSMPVAEMDNHIQVGAEVESSTSLTEPADEASMIIDDSVERDERRTSTTKDITESGRRDEAPRHAVSKRKEAPKPDVRPKKKDVADEGFQRGDIFEVAISPERTIARGSQPTAKKSAKIDSKPKSKVKARAKAPLTIAKKTSETKQPAKKMSQPLEKKTAKGSRTLVDAPDKHIPVLRKRNNKSMKELSDSEEPSSGDEVHGEDGAVVTGKLKKEQVTIIEKPIVTAAKAHSKKAEPAPSNPSAITQSPQQRQLLSAKQEGEPAHNAPQMPDDDSSIPQQRLPLSVAMEDDLVLHSSDEVAGEGHIVANIQKGRVAIDGAEQPTEIRVARKMGSIFAEAVSAATKRRERAARTYEPSLITAKVTTVSISEQRFIEPSSPSVEPIGRRSNQPAAPMTIPIPSRRSVMAEVVEMKQIPFKGNPAAKRDREHLSDSSSPFIDSDEKTLHSVQQSRQAPKGKEQLPSPKSKPQPRSEVPVEQTPQRLEPVPRGTPLLVDDYVARKTPLVAFDKNGPKNQGLSSFLRGSAIARIKAQDTASSASKHQSSAKKRARAAENHQSVDYNTTKKQRIIAMVDLVSSDDDTEDDKELSSQRIPTSSGILMRSGSSMSRVDHNGSPRVARSGGMTRFGSGLGRVLDGPTLALIDMSDEDGLAYVPSDDNEEDSSPENDSLFGGRKLPPLTGNRKVQPSGPNELVDFDKRYTPHHSVGNEYIAVKSKHTVIQEQAVDDPFTKQAIQETEKPSQTIPKQQRSNVEQSEESANQPRVATLRSLNRFVAFNKLDSRVTRQTVADPDKTLVEISVSDEPTFTRQQPKKYLNASSDSDTEDSEMGTESPGMQEPPPGQVWHDALRPYQQDLSNLLHYTVDALLQHLFDKEQAVTLVPPQLSHSGSAIVNALADNAAVSRCRLQSDAAEALRQTAVKLRVSKSFAHKMAATRKSTAKTYDAWRNRQHALHRLPYMGKLK